MTITSPRLSAATRVVVCTAGLLLVLAAPSAAAPGDPEPVPEDPRIPNLPVTAVPNVAILERARSAGNNWDPAAARYASSYVHPSNYFLVLDACTSSAGTGPTGNPFAMEGYEWLLEPLDGQFVAPITKATTVCREIVPVRALGRWRIALTTRSSNGRAAREAVERRFRDVVIVALGDSFVSGEGNPERGAIVRNKRVIRTASWTDRRCHRSEHSWAMRTARAFEDASTAVTFLNLGCSGAETPHVWGGRGYRGIAPPSSNARLLEPQIRAARTALGDPFSLNVRPVHAVLMTIGVNDAEFSSILRDCAAIDGPEILGQRPFFEPIVSDPCSEVPSTRYVRALIKDLRHDYDRIEASLAAHLHVPSAAVRVAEYPTRIMTDRFDRHRGCGLFTGISGSEASWISERGEELLAQMRAAAARHDWRYVGGVRDAFRGHGYCADALSWFRGAWDSIDTQANIEGTAHPTELGHAAIAALVRPTLPAEPLSLPPPARIKVEFTRYRVGNPLEGLDETGFAEPRGPGRFFARFGAEHFSSATLTNENRRLPLGRWISIPGEQREAIVQTTGSSFDVVLTANLPSLKVEAPDTPKGFRVTGSRRVRYDVYHRRADRWRLGTHKIGGERGIQLEYKVSPELFNPGIQTFGR